MGVLSHLEPKSVFGYFEEMCGIPHGSGNVKKMSDYLVSFAKERDLFYIQDEVYNVIICKEATKGYEEHEPIMMQAHMDMVAVKKQNATIDMEREGLTIGVEGDWIFAKDTSLGGDNGIGVAYALAALDSVELKHPRLECIFTVDEETGMEGATAIDLSMLKGKQLLNIDSEEEGILLTSCAGGAHFLSELILEEETMTGLSVTISIGGCKGGHSGMEIIKGRANANCLLFRALLRLSKEICYGLVSVEGGLKDNAIPREAVAKIIVKQDEYDTLNTILEELQIAYNQEYMVKEDGISIQKIKGDSITGKAIIGGELKRAIAAILTQPDGVQSMSSTMEGVVETSLNLGILTIEEGRICAQYAVRSSVDSAKNALLDRLSLLIEQLGGTYEIRSIYPAWEYLEASALRDKMIRVYRECYGEEMELQGVHAGLECGILAQKIQGLDCVSFGPNMKHIHTTEEAVSIASVARVWEYIVAVLEVS